MKGSRKKTYLTTSQISFLGFTFRNVNSKQKIEIYYKGGSSPFRVPL